MNNKIHLDFLILGAQKAGTTSIHDWLVQHSDICLPEVKETHFFSHQSRFEKGEGWYLGQFPLKKNTLTGEIDPEYLYIEAAAEKIQRLTDAHKFIIVLRQPLQRAYSHYLMTVRRGFEDLPFDQAVDVEKERLLCAENEFAIDHQSYISRGLYSKQIERYRALFPEGEFLFIKFDDLIEKTKGYETYLRICEFIGTTHDASLVNRSKSSNQASTPRWGWLRNMIYHRGGKSSFRKIISSILSNDLKLRMAMFADKLNQRNMSKSEIRPLAEYKISQEIIAEMLLDIERTEALTGLSLLDWKAHLKSLNFN